LQSFGDDVLIRPGPRVKWIEFSEATPGAQVSRLRSVGLACLGVQTCRDFHNLRPGAKPLSLNFCKSHHARRDARGDECRLRDATPPKPDHLETTGTRLEAEERGVQSMYSSLSEEYLSTHFRSGSTVNQSFLLGRVQSLKSRVVPVATPLTNGSRVT